MSATNSNSNNTSNSANNANPNPPVYNTSTELHDLGRTRFDHDTAAPSERDTALTLAPTHSAIPLRTGHAPRGLEAQVHAWTTFQFTTTDVDAGEELKGDLHGGQLHRVNRAARGEERVVRGGGGSDEGALCAGRKGEGSDARPLAKGMAEEMDKEMFWSERIM